MSTSGFQSLYGRWTQQGEASEDKDSILKLLKEE